MGLLNNNNGEWKYWNSSFKLICHIPKQFVLVVRISDAGPNPTDVAARTLHCTTFPIGRWHMFTCTVLPATVLFHCCPDPLQRYYNKYVHIKR